MLDICLYWAEPKCCFFWLPGQKQHSSPKVNKLLSTAEIICTTCFNKLPGLPQRSQIWINIWRTGSTLLQHQAGIWYMSVTFFSKICVKLCWKVQKFQHDSRCEVLNHITYRNEKPRNRNQTGCYMLTFILFFPLLFWWNVNVGILINLSQENLRFWGFRYYLHFRKGHSVLVNLICCRVWNSISVPFVTVIWKSFA